MTRHTNEKLAYRDGMIYTASGISIARMDRGEPRTSPTERDANAGRIVQAWNAMPDVTKLLEHFYVSRGYYRFSSGIAKEIAGVLKKISEEVPDD